MAHKDDGNPCNYYFVVDDVSEPGHPTVMFTPILYWKQEQYQSDWDLNISIQWLNDLMESTYEILWNVLGGPQTPQEAHDLLIAAGYVYSPAFASMAGIHGNSSIVTKTAKPKTAKLSTAFFKDYIQNVMAPDPKYGEIFNAYDGQPAETASLRRGKDWKRLFKKKGTIESLADYDCSIGHSMATTTLIEHCSGQMEFDEVFDTDYIYNFENTIVVREFWWTGNPEQDTTISFITDADDQGIVAICTHID